VGAALLAACGLAGASSHREAPFITTTPKVDGTDFYMFRSYEPAASDFVTLIANYLPLQDAYGGPNYFAMDPNALYEIHVDNNGDAKEDLSFQFRFKNTLAGNGAGVNLMVGGKNGRHPADPGRCGQPTPRTRQPAAGTRPSASPWCAATAAAGTAQAVTNAARRRQPFRQAGRQHRHEDDPRLRRLRRQARLQRSTSRAATCRPGCSSGSARTRSRSTWARSSTWSTRRWP
jgi:hypothetical protein